MPSSIIKFINKMLPRFIKNQVWKYQDDTRSNESRSLRFDRVKTWEKNGKSVPTPHEIKQINIEYFQSMSGYDTLVETGTYLGDMLEAQRTNFKRIYSVELSKELWRRAVERFKKYPHIKIVQGDSGKVLSSIIKDLDKPAIFWLDGHYSAGDTALGDKECPIFEEINSIFEDNKKLDHILLVDDARLFVGENDYPTIEQLTSYIKAKRPEYHFSLKDDILVYQIA